MSYPGLHSPELVLMLTGLLAESLACLFYLRFKVRARKLARTGRMTDIEVAHNWQSFFGVVLVAIPVLVYLVQ